MTKHPWHVFWLVACLVAGPLAGCGSDDNPADPGPDPPGPPPGYATPAEAVQAWSAALAARDLEAVGKLLEPVPAGRAEAGFRFYPQSADLDDFPWMTSESWSRAEELTILGHMMDSTHVSQENGNSVDSIVATQEIQQSEEVGEGTLALTHATFQVLWAENSGAIAEVRLEILLVRNADGYFVMRSMRELPLLRDPRSSIEAVSWGRIKAMYR